MDITRDQAAILVVISVFFLIVSLRYRLYWRGNTDAPVAVDTRPTISRKSYFRRNLGFVAVAVGVVVFVISIL